MILPATAERRLGIADTLAGLSRTRATPPASWLARPSAGTQARNRAAKTQAV